MNTLVQYKNHSILTTDILAETNILEKMASYKLFQEGWIMQSAIA